MSVLVIGGVFVASFLGNNAQQKPSAMPNPAGVSTAAKSKSQPMPALPEHKDDRSADKPIRTAPATAQASSVESKIAEKSEKATTTIAASGKPVLTAWESYEIVRPTRVFSAPSEHSQLVANVEPGTQVNVVDSRNGWLEIRSKYGRPPGFIQKTAAIRIGQNN
jgi:Bacterial SH3 domain